MIYDEVRWADVVRGNIREPFEKINKRVFAQRVITGDADEDFHASYTRTLPGE